MKICLLANPRTGSTSLYGLILAHLSSEYYCVSEPFNPHYMKYVGDNRNHIKMFHDHKDVFFKHIIYQYPTIFETKELWYNWLFVNFDKILLLDRKNRLLQSESFVYHETKNRSSWHIQSYYDLSGVDESKIKERIDLLEQDGQFILEKSKDYPLFYYEDLFVEKDINKINELLTYLGIESKQKYIDRFIFSDSLKVRKETKNTKLL